MSSSYLEETQELESIPRGKVQGLLNVFTGTGIVTTQARALAKERAWTKSAITAAELARKAQAKFKTSLSKYEIHLMAEKGHQIKDRNAVVTAQQLHKNHRHTVSYQDEVLMKARDIALNYKKSEKEIKAMQRDIGNTMSLYELGCMKRRHEEEKMKENERIAQQERANISNSISFIDEVAFKERKIQAMERKAIAHAKQMMNAVKSVMTLQDVNNHRQLQRKKCDELAGVQAKTAMQNVKNTISFQDEVNFKQSKTKKLLQAAESEARKAHSKVKNTISYQDGLHLKRQQNQKMMESSEKEAKEAHSKIRNCITFQDSILAKQRSCRQKDYITAEKTKQDNMRNKYTAIEWVTETSPSNNGTTTNGSNASSGNDPLDNATTLSSNLSNLYNNNNHNSHKNNNNNHNNSNHNNNNNNNNTFVNNNNNKTSVNTKKTTTKVNFKTSSFYNTFNYNNSSITKNAKLLYPTKVNSSSMQNDETQEQVIHSQLQQQDSTKLKDQKHSHVSEKDNVASYDENNNNGNNSDGKSDMDGKVGVDKDNHDDHDDDHHHKPIQEEIHHYSLEEVDDYHQEEIHQTIEEELNEVDEELDFHQNGTFPTSEEMDFQEEELILHNNTTTTFERDLLEEDDARVGYRESFIMTSSSFVFTTNSPSNSLTDKVDCDDEENYYCDDKNCCDDTQTYSRSELDLLTLQDSSKDCELQTDGDIDIMEVMSSIQRSWISTPNAVQRDMVNSEMDILPEAIVQEYRRVQEQQNEQTEKYNTFNPSEEGQVDNIKNALTDIIDDAFQRMDKKSFTQEESNLFYTQRDDASIAEIEDISVDVDSSYPVEIKDVQTAFDVKIKDPLYGKMNSVTDLNNSMDKMKGKKKRKYSKRRKGRS